MFLRILLWSLIIFLLIRFLWRIIAPLFEGEIGSRPGDKAVSGDSPEKEKRTEYDDVQDAKYKDLPGDKGPPKDDRRTGS